MDLYHSIVFVGACIAFFAMYKVLSWFINRRYYVPKVAPPKINETYGARRLRMDAQIRANLETSGEWTIEQLAPQEKPGTEVSSELEYPVDMKDVGAVPTFSANISTVRRSAA